MALRITCSSCGKNLQVHDDLAGKKVKCPACKTILVAGAAVSATDVKAAAPKLAPGAAAIDRDKVSPKPMAKRPAPPPMDDDDVDERPVRPRRNRDEDEDNYDDRPARSAKKGKKKAAAGGSLLWLWLSLGGVVLIGGGLAAYFMFFNGPPTTAAVAQGNNQKGGAGGVALAELVPGDAIFFATVSSDVWNAKALEPLRPLVGKTVEDGFQKNLGFPLNDLDRISVFTVTDLEEAKKISVGPTVFPVVVLVQSKKPFDQAAVTAALKSGELGRNPQMVVEFVNERTLATSMAPLLQKFKDKKGQIKATGVLERALTQAATSTGLVFSVVIPPEVVNEARKDLKDVEQFAGAFFKTKSVLGSLDLSDKLQVNVSLVMEDAAAATEAKKAADGLVAMGQLMLGGFAKDPQMAPLVKSGQDALNSLKIGIQDKEVTFGMQSDAGAIIAGLLPAIQKVRGAATSVQASNNLKQIALAWLNYHDVFSGFPPQTYRAPPYPPGTPPPNIKGLSWRVAILPFLEQNELYKQFKLDEPWDSAHNKKLIPLMPKIYESANSTAPPGMTYYQSFTGPNTINKNSIRGMRVQEILDGMSNTIIVAEAAEPVEWTRPVDIQVVPNQPILLGGDASGTMAAYADATVRRLPRNFDQKVLRWLIDPADGNVIPNFDGSPPPRPMLKGKAPQPPVKGNKIFQDK